MISWLINDSAEGNEMFTRKELYGSQLWWNFNVQYLPAGMKTLKADMNIDCDADDFPQVFSAGEALKKPFSTNNITNCAMIWHEMKQTYYGRSRTFHLLVLQFLFICFVYNDFSIILFWECVVYLQPFGQLVSLWGETN